MNTSTQKHDGRSASSVAGFTEGGVTSDAAPLVSVVIPTYNRAATLARAIESVLTQTYANKEVIVVDDGSTDHTAGLVRGFGRGVRLVQQLNAGPSAARNTGVAASRGDILAFLDSDDVWLPRKLERQVDLLCRGDVPISCCVCNASLRHDDAEFARSFALARIASDDADGYLMNPAEILATRFLLFNQVVAVRRDALLRAGGFRSELRLLEDYDLAFRLALLGPWGIIGEPLVIKNEETDGIGVSANRDRRVRANQFKRVIAGLLREDFTPETRGAQVLLSRALREVDAEVRAVESISQASTLSVASGRVRLLWLKVRRAVRRRLPSWPTAEIRALSLAPRGRTFVDSILERARAGETVSVLLCVVFHQVVH